jgi:CNP1-like family
VNPARYRLLAPFALTGLIALAAFEAVAQELPMRDEAADTMDFSEAPFKEDKLTLPAPPKPENLIKFDAGPARPGFENFVDGSTLTLDSDGVIRYTLVVKSDMGASNVSYEGIRCATRERKVYAYGLRDGTWAKPRDPEWKKIGAPRVEGPVYVLYNDFFCPGRQAVRSSEEAIAALKAGAHPRASDDTPSRLIPLAR